MSVKSFLMVGCFSAIALGSVVAYAQAVSPEASVEAPAAGAAPELSSGPSDTTTQSSGAVPSLDPAPDSGSVEDAPVDVSTAPQSDWAPDTNSDAQAQAQATPKAQPSRAKPRKLLSDAGENPQGSGSWGTGSNSDTAQAQLLSRANRRERAIDPIKRSDLTKLSRVMGALHALRVSCSGRDDQTYRSRMATLLDLEAPDSGGLRDPLVDAFNGGFQAYGRGASSCPADARTQEAALAKDGYALARSMSARYRPAPKVMAALPPATQPRQNVVIPAKPTAAPGVLTATKPAVPQQAKAPAQPPPSARATWNNATPN